MWCIVADEERSMRPHNPLRGARRRSTTRPAPQAPRTPTLVPPRA